jgi:hypothetical protein
MRYIAESGDVIGWEIKIVFTGSAFQGVVQIAEGVPGELAIVDINVDGTKISFSMQGRSSYTGKFSGTIENGLLRGEFRFKDGVVESVALQRGKSYWD